MKQRLKQGPRYKEIGYGVFSKEGGEGCRVE